MTLGPEYPKKWTFDSGCFWKFMIKDFQVAELADFHLLNDLLNYQKLAEHDVQQQLFHYLNACSHF